MAEFIIIKGGLFLSSLKRMLLLTKIIVKSTDMGISFGKNKNKLKKKNMSIAGLILLGFVYVYFAAITLFVSNGFYETLKPLGLQSAMLSYATALFAFMIFFFGIFYIISVFYFTKDIEQLLAMPFNAYEIIGGKFLSVIIYEYITTSLLLVPFVLYGVLEGQGLLYYIYTLLVVLLLPIIPLAITAVIIMPMMRFVKFARNKDAFNMVSGILVLFLAFGANIYFQSFASTEGNLGSIASASAQRLSDMTSRIFIGTSFASKALANAHLWEGLLYIFLFVLLCAVAFLFVLFLANALYLKAATAVSSSNASHKRLNDKTLSKTLLRTPAFVTYMKKDIYILIRTPIFFLNNVVMNFIWPVLILIMIGIKSENQGSVDVKTVISSLDYSNIGKLGVILMIVFGASVILSGMNGITASALSREGSCFPIMQYIPLSYFHQILAKIAVGFLFSYISILCGLAVIIYLAMPPLWVVLLAALVALPACLFSNLCGIVFELLWPKLHWDNEQKAVKQNMNVLLGMFLPFGLAVPIIIAGFMVPMDLWLSFFLLFISGSILDFIFLVILKQVVPLRLKKIEY